MTEQDVVVKTLNDAGIPAKFSFKPMSRQPEYLGKFKHLNAHRLSREVIYFPVNPQTDTKEQIKGYVGALREIL
jgi:dTDP-4-amino-4,6-dideoxygalactose transaminase